MQLCSKGESKKDNSGDKSSSSDQQTTTKEPTVVELSSLSGFVLYQNTPNPFGNTTSIAYYVPDNTGNILIQFSDEMGQNIKTVEIAEKGYGTLQINPSNLQSGIYTYSMLVNGKVVDTKKMIYSK